LSKEQAAHVQVWATETALQPAARALAAALDLPYLAQAPPFPSCENNQDTAPALLLCVTAQRLELRECRVRAAGPVFVDFGGGALDYRRRHSHGRKQPLARACGLKPGHNPRILDATAGLGRDGFLLAGLGCEVQLLERSPVIAALLADGLRRAAQDVNLAELLAGRLTLTQADARCWLPSLAAAERPAVIYLDPMYPHRQKTALVKKDMRIFRSLLGNDEDAPDLLAAALACATARVVVKRPKGAEPVRGPAPSLHIASPNTRFDVYLRG